MIYLNVYFFIVEFTYHCTNKCATKIKYNIVLSNINYVSLEGVVKRNTGQFSSFILKP